MKIILTLTLDDDRYDGTIEARMVTENAIRDFREMVESEVASFFEPVENCSLDVKVER